MSEIRRKRPWLAAVLAFVYPGLGHVYLREWLRAILWFGLVMSATWVLVPSTVFPAELSAEALLEAYGRMPMEASGAIFVITVLSMADAYWMATRENRRAATAEGVKCPHCGKELDEDLEFCHWCTTRLVEPANDDEFSGQ